jgi:hypothetical protein
MADPKQELPHELRSCLVCGLVTNACFFIPDPQNPELRRCPECWSTYNKESR